MIRLSTTAALLAFAMTAMGCSLITDFETKTDKFSIDQNLGDTVTVTLSSAGTGSLALQMTSELPDADDTELLGLLDDGTIAVTVSRETGDNFELADGTRVDDTPNGDGEYSLSLSADRTTVTVTFYNEIDGSSLVSGDDYTVVISVLPNDYFDTENLERGVTVIGG